MSKTLLIDVSSCINCEVCVVACKDEHFENSYPPYTESQPETGHFWMKVNVVERGKIPKLKVASIPLPCMHCDDAPCIKAGTGGAVYKRKDGIVIIDPVKSKGQRQLVASCPYGVIYYNEEKDIPQKCTLCVHRGLENGGVPKCVLSCPTDALTFAEYSGQQDYEPLYPEYNAKPTVYYKALPKTFIAGALVDSNGECLAGADVTAKDTAAAKIVASTKSDVFGDFWLEGLDVKKTYEVAISAAGKTKTVSVSLDKDTDLGDIQL